MYVAQHFQRNIVRGIEGYISISAKKMDIARKLAEDCCKYGAENLNSDNCIARTTLDFGTSHGLMENERETLLGILRDQVSEPLRALITGAPLEDARHLVHRYDRLRQEVEAQAAEVLRRRSKTKESDVTPESCLKLRNAEERLTELKSTMKALGRETTDAMLSVEDQQQQTTFERLFAMVDAERSYHQHVLTLLDKLYDEMSLEEQSIQSSSVLVSAQKDVNTPTAHQDVISNEPDDPAHINQPDEPAHINQPSTYFIAKVVHPFDAQTEGELSLSVDDYVVVRQVAATGWSEGEFKGNAGWFPSAYVVRQDIAPARKLVDESSSP
ncbi:SH3 domain-containing protein 1-like isoform X2 [Tripterygium wilfordii]|uniref:SH3 domain-containing protein 1-like isoform X2 n=1 Tax=Tripterygium wilfordii TaxID=458696 RepID=UPI0018F7FDFA|nr:SH3 domain-containing protein 1-like isoform X2 [Tripterygium wilfordii]